jgi:putative NADH-flavin reductase
MRRTYVKFIVFGANGGVGRSIVDQGLKRGHEVTAAVRAPGGGNVPHGARIALCDVMDTAAVQRAIAGHDAVFCAVGTRSTGPLTLYSTAARNIVAAMQTGGIRRLVFLSNFGVLNERGVGLRQSMLLFLIARVLRHTLNDHRAALEVMAASDIDWTAVRAMALNNERLTGKYRLAIDGLPEKGTQIARADVAHFMLEAVERGALSRRTPAISY